MPRLSAKTEVASMSDTDQFAIVQGGNVRLIDRANTGLAESADVDASLATKADDADLSAHAANTSNPHAVTKAQVGLANVPNTDATARANHTGTQAISTVTGLQTALDGKVEDADIADFETTTELNARDTANRSRSNHTGSQAISTVTGLQTALDGKAASSHNHTSSEVSDFTEAVQDAVAALLAQGTGITLSYDDTANTLTITGSGGGGGGLDAEAVRDAIGVALIGSGLISVTVNDAADTITISTTATANDTDANLKNRANHTGEQAISTVTGLQATLNDKANSADLGTAAIEDTTAFATAAQGATADSAVQPGDLGAVATSNSYNDLDDKPTIPAAGVESIAKSGSAALTGAVTLSAGSNVTLTQTGQNIEIAASGGGGGSAGAGGFATVYPSWDLFTVTTGGGASTPTNYQLIISGTGQSVDVRKQFGLKSTLIPTPMYMTTIWEPTCFGATGSAKYYHRWFSTNTSATDGTKDQIGWSVEGTNNVWNDTAFSSGNGTTEQSTTAAVSYDGFNPYATRTEAVFDGTSVEFYVDGVLKSTHSTNVPRTGTLVKYSWSFMSRIEATASTAAGTRMGLIGSTINWGHPGA